MRSDNNTQHNVDVICSRCRKVVQGVRDTSFTGGFYDVGRGGTWRAFARPGEKRLCDSCMHGSPEYQIVYGVLEGFTDVRDTPRGRLIQAKLKAMAAAQDGPVPNTDKPYVVGSREQSCSIFGPTDKTVVRIEDIRK